MIIKPGDTIKIRSYKSVENEFGIGEFNSEFIGWGKQVIYLGVIEQERYRIRIKAEALGHKINTDSRCVENGDMIVFCGDYTG